MWLCIGVEVKMAGLQKGDGGLIFWSVLWVRLSDIIFIQ